MVNDSGFPFMKFPFKNPFIQVVEKKKKTKVVHDLVIVELVDGFLRVAVFVTRFYFFFCITFSIIKMFF